MTPEVQSNLLREAQTWWDAIRRDGEMENIHRYGEERLRVAQSIGPVDFMRDTAFGKPAMVISYYHRRARAWDPLYLPWVVAIWVFPEGPVSVTVGLRISEQIVLTTWRREGDIKDNMSVHSL